MAGYEFEGEVRPPANVLANRYATPEVVGLFSDDARIVYERNLWIDVMEIQTELGLDIPVEAPDDYREVIDVIDHGWIRKLEGVTKHDVDARIEEFNDLAGHQQVHKGMTSRDLTENIEQFQIHEALKIFRGRSIATLARFAARAAEWEILAMCGRSHNVAAQTITTGKRFSNWGEEMLFNFGGLEDLIERYPLRGIKGPVGTQQDMLDLFEGDSDKVLELERRIAERLGFTAMWGSVGQVYPRSLDKLTVDTMHQLAAGPANFAKNVRLMAGQELATEGFLEGQVGSSAMPHKKNARTSERIGGFNVLLAMHSAGIAHLSGNQWNEGDVSCSVVRRVIMPDACFTMDGLLESTMTVLDNMGVYPAMINRELNRFLPFLITTKVLMACVKAGMGREDAHKIIKKHAVAAAVRMNEEGAENDLLDRLDADEGLPVTKSQLEGIMERPIELTGRAREQVGEFVAKIETLVAENPKEAAYNPQPIL